MYDRYMNKTTFLQRFIANKVRFHRKAKDLSQEELSEKAGLGLKYINQLENLSSNLSIQTLEKVILALDMTPEEFFDFRSLEGKRDSNHPFSLKCLNMKIKQLPKEKQEVFVGIFEEILDNLDW
ncbi:hypothetical protein ANG6_0460 [Streptococcus anginosus T5]|uniref:HTH cro/C1-type domain-containing protein n=2 Tax=Streptococcus anginosus TaxID=1328 RepID=A0AAN4T4Y8_STRAP|nr:hypothetical protein ANG6_0460 [Streptococcus anginosus T5]